MNMDNALKIWNMVPFNSTRSKLEDMDIHPEYDIKDLYLKHPGIFNAMSEVVEDMSGNDTMVYRDEIMAENRPAKETYEDEPILIPYIVPNSDKCIICCPGGGYLNKSMEAEGEDIAEFLNAAGISCFVLWYRSYPYLAPVMYRDCQRAIRYVRFHAEKYGINPEKIGIIGFSAGGNLCGITVEIFRDSAVEAEGYVSDEIDGVSASVKALAMIYPAISFEESRSFLSAIEDRDKLSDPAERKRVAEYYTLKNHVQKGDPSTFLCCAADDMIVPSNQICEYAAACKKAGISFELHVFSTGGHGFGGCRENPDAMVTHDLARTSQWRDLFASWVKEELDRTETVNPMDAYKNFAF